MIKKFFFKLAIMLITLTIVAMPLILWFGAGWKPVFLLSWFSKGLTEILRTIALVLNVVFLIVAVPVSWNMANGLWFYYFVDTTPDISVEQDETI